MVQHRHPRRAIFAASSLFALVLSVVAVLAVTGPASAADSKTSAARATLVLDGAAAKHLRSAGVKVGASRKATIRKTTLSLPVSVSVVGTTAAVGLNGTLTFRSGKRKLSLTGLRVMVSKKRAIQVLAKTSGGQFPILTGTVAKKALTLDAFRSTATFTATSVKLTPRAAKLLKTTLRLKKTPTGSLGKLTLLPAASTTSTTGTPTTPGPIPTTPGTTTPTTPGSTTPTAPVPGTGPKPCTASAPATSAMSEPVFDLLPVNAVEIKSACITWHPRDSWIDYTNSGPTTGDGSALTAPATAEPANAACGALLPRDFHFQFHRGWFDPSTGQTVLQYDGTVRFRYQTHGIDISFQNPEVQLGGATPQVTFRRAPGAGGRLPVLTLDQSGPSPKLCNADPGPVNSHDPTGVSGPRTYERLAAKVSPSGAPMFDSGGEGGAYAPGTDFGWLSVSFTPAP